MHINFFGAAVVVGLTEDASAVPEAADSLAVCANLTGLIERTVVVMLSTMDGTALGR